MRACIFLFLLLLVSCGKNEFELQFDLDENITDNYNVTYYATASQGGVTVQAVASVMKGKCELKGFTRLPTLVFITSKRDRLPLVILAQKGEKISITGDLPTPLDWNVEGNKFNEDLTEWRLQNRELITENDPEKLNAAVKDFVDSGAPAEEALVALLTYYDRGIDEEGYASLMARLADFSQADKWIKIASRADQLSRRALPPASVLNMVMRSQNGYADTVYFTGNAPGFMAFWHLDTKNRKEIIDSLKVLAKEYPDTTSRIFIDVCLDADSASWRNNLRRDTLKAFYRLRAPAGLADADVMKLRVGSVPYYIVLDRGGKQVYRGTEIKEATAKFREIYHTVDTIAP